MPQQRHGRTISAISAGSFRRLTLAAMVAVLTGAAPAAAQPVPLPKPAPRLAASPPAAAGPAAAAVLPRGQTMLPPSVRAPAGNGPAAPVVLAQAGRANAGASGRGGFDAAQRALVDKISAYLSSVQVMTGKFVQVGPDGARTEGQLYIQKPGRVRFEYNAPSPIAIIADGQSVAVRDRKLATQDIYPLSQTPLRYLLADRIDLLRDTNVTRVTADDVFATVVIEERQALVGTSKLMMMFGAQDLQLRQWTVTDPQGYDTTVAVYNLETGKRPDPSLFKIDYTRYDN